MGDDIQVLFIRHGEKNEDGTLTKLGVRQAEITGEILAGQGIERLFSSPFPRARQTALIVSRKIGLPVEIRHRLHERAGPGRRMTKSEITARFPEFIVPEDMPEVWWPDVKESWEDVHERVRPVVEEFKSLEVKHERIAAVAHGGSIDAMVSVWIGCPPMKQVKFQNHNCAFTLISCREGMGRIHYTNQVTHLGYRDLFFY